MTATQENPTVVIVGSGIAGLALGNFLLRGGVDCVILEKHSREHVEHRQRAGALDAAGVRMLDAWGLGEAVESPGRDATDAAMPLIVDGAKRAWKTDDVEDGDGTFCPQQVLVRNLIGLFLRDGGDLRFEAADVSPEQLLGDHARVRYRDAEGRSTTLTCDVVAGCDGYQGTSRRAIPADHLTGHTHEFGYAWLAVTTDVPAEPLAVMAVHPRGFAAQITRGPHASRLYLQCPVTDTVGDWPSERIWSELETRFGTRLSHGAIVTADVVPLRGVVFSPMNYGRLYLVGDAAHLISPMSAEGMSLALHDADVLANAIIARVDHDDETLLASYSPTCLQHIWQRQAAAIHMTDVMHDAGDARYRGPFLKQVARTNLESFLQPLPGDV